MNRNVFLLFMGLTAMIAAGCSDGGSNTSSSSGSASSGSGGQGGGGGQGGEGQGGAGGQGGSGGQGGGNALCADRPAGALVTFDIVGQSFTVWITNTAFIDEAKMLKEQGMQRVPVFQQVIDGQDCDPQWTFHVDPEGVSFADFTIELCDGTPQYIEDNTADWISQVKQYCPWSAKVTNVDVHP